MPRQAPGKHDPGRSFRKLYLSYQVAGLELQKKIQRGGQNILCGGGFAATSGPPPHRRAARSTPPQGGPLAKGNRPVRPLRASVVPAPARAPRSPWRCHSIRLWLRSKPRHPRSLCSRPLLCLSSVMALRLSPCPSHGPRLAPHHEKRGSRTFVRSLLIGPLPYGRGQSDFWREALQPSPRLLHGLGLYPAMFCERKSDEILQDHGLRDTPGVRHVLYSFQQRRGQAQRQSPTLTTGTKSPTWAPSFS